MTLTIFTLENAQMGEEVNEASIFFAYNSKYYGSPLVQTKNL